MAIIIRGVEVSHPVVKVAHSGGCQGRTVVRGRRSFGRVRRPTGWWRCRVVGTN